MTEAPALSRDLGLEYVARRVMPSAYKWQRRIWLDEEYPLQNVGFNRWVLNKEVGGAVKRVQRKAITLGCYMRGAEAEMLGFMVGEELDGDLVIYFAYTKPVYRKAGVFAFLLSEFGYDPADGFVTSSWRFAAGNHGGRKRKLRAHFNPYILFRRAYDQDS